MSWSSTPKRQCGGCYSERHLLCLFLINIYTCSSLLSKISLSIRKLSSICFSEKKISKLSPDITKNVLLFKVINLTCNSIQLVLNLNHHFYHLIHYMDFHPKIKNENSKNYPLAMISYTNQLVWYSTLPTLFLVNKPMTFPIQSKWIGLSANKKILVHTCLQSETGCEFTLIRFTFCFWTIGRCARCYPTTYPCLYLV